MTAAEQRETIQAMEMKSHHYFAVTHVSDADHSVIKVGAERATLDEAKADVPNHPASGGFHREISEYESTSGESKWLADYDINGDLIMAVGDDDPTCECGSGKPSWYNPDTNEFDCTDCRGEIIECACGTAHYADSDHSTTCEHAASTKKGGKV